MESIRECEDDRERADSNAEGDEDGYAQLDHVIVHALARESHVPQPLGRVGRLDGEKDQQRIDSPLDHPGGHDSKQPKGNMTALAEMGAIIAPPVPGFYTKPQTVMDIVDHSVERVLDLLGLPVPGARRWEGAK